MLGDSNDVDQPHDAFERVRVVVSKVNFEEGGCRLLTIDNIEAVKCKIKTRTGIPIEKQRLFLIGQTWIEVEDWFHLGNEVFDEFYEHSPNDKNELKTLNLHFLQRPD